MGSNRRQCPHCKVTLKRGEWTRLWWMSSGLSGRLVHPCPECGTLLRLSGMRLLSAVGAVGLISTSIGLLLRQTLILLFFALFFALIILIGVLATRIETVPQAGSGDLPLEAEDDLTKAELIKAELAKQEPHGR